MNDPILDDLNPAQREAAAHRDGPMLVVAGAGSGKTRVVTRRIANLIRGGVRPWRILALTFTNKAAAEMRGRVAELVGEAPRWVGTFHSACARFLRFDLDKLDEGRSGRFTILDDADQLGLVKKIARDMNIDDPRLKPRAILARISKAKNAGQSPAEFSLDGWGDEIVQRAFERYERRLRGLDALDFDDLLGLTVRMLEKLPELRESYQRRFPYLLVDEYQDTNPVQYRLMRLLAGRGNNVHVTGDPDQSIYSWRGADYRNIMDFRKDFPDARIVRLEQNYRSTAPILSAANHLIHHNRDRIEKDLFTDRGEGRPVAVARLPSDRMEGDWIARAVQSLAADGRAWGDFAVFYRTNAQSRAIEEALIRAGLGARYQIIGGLRFYERREVKDLLAHLKLLVNPRDGLSLARVAGCRPTGVGEKTLAKIEAAAEEAGMGAFAYLAAPFFAERFGRRATGARLAEFAAFCRKLAAVDTSRADVAVRGVLEASELVPHWMAQGDKDESGEERVDNLYALANRAGEFVEQRAAAPAAPVARMARVAMATDGDAKEGGEEKEGIGPEEASAGGIDLAAFLEDVALVADVDGWDGRSDRISLMSLHAAKGLEFPVVFVTGLETGILPHRNADSDFKVEEERRLFYVGLTRAREVAFVTLAGSRYMNGMGDYCSPSMFLRELPGDEVLSYDFGESWGAGDGSWAAGWAHARRDAPVITPGEKAGPATIRAADRDAPPDFDDDFADGFDPDFDDADFIGADDDEAAARPAPAPSRPVSGNVRKKPFAAAGRRQLPPARGGLAARSPGAPTPMPASTGGGAKAGDFRIGQAVRHPSFGRGVVKARKGDRVVVNFATAGLKTLLPEIARLTVERE